MHLVSRLARTQVTVALSGDGGDELFAGYNRHAWLERLWRRSSVLPGSARRMVGAALGRVPPALSKGRPVPPRFCRRTPRSERDHQSGQGGEGVGGVGPEEAYLSLASYWDDAESMVIGAGPPCRWPPGRRSGPPWTGSPSRCCGWT